MKAKFLFGLCLASCLVAGCSRPETPGSMNNAVQKHEHHPPHGGTAVELGQEEYHLELVLDPQAGKIQMFVLDGELEKFVRISAASMEVTARIPGQEQRLVFLPVANNATGETIGDTSLFEAQAEWLKSIASFDAVLKEVVVKGNPYTNIAFNFPKGNDEAAKK